VTHLERFELREATLADVEAIAHVNVAAGRAGWAAFLPPERLARFEPPVERWRERLADAGAGGAWVATEAGEVIGFAMTRPCGAGRTEGELTALYTHPRAWGAGAGTRLLAAALEALAASGCRAATLWTEERNLRPRAFYERRGWRADGAARERDFLGTQIRELRYRTELTPVAGGAPDAS
jgi:ribosomal protein S18 acetylase RimI-like enzyme